MHSFNYLVPALFWNATVYDVISLGNLSTGGLQILGKVKSATLRSEPGFSPSFTATFRYGADYVTIDPLTPVARPHLSGTVFPDDGSTPFLMQVTGIQFPDPQVEAVTGGGSTETIKVPYGADYSVWTPTFFGGAEKYQVLQTSIFVASETVSTSDEPGEFLVGLKISKVYPVKTNITIGEEFP